MRLYALNEVVSYHKLFCGSPLILQYIKLCYKGVFSVKSELCQYVTDPELSVLGACQKDYVLWMVYDREEFSPVIVLISLSTSEELHRPSVMLAIL